MTDLDGMRGRLLEVQAALTELPDDAFSQRIDLRIEERELRAELRTRSLAGDLMGADQLEHHIAELEQQIEDHYANRLSHISGPQTGYGGGIDPQILHAMHRQMDEAADIDRLKENLRRLKDRLSATRRRDVDGVREDRSGAGEPPDR